jgi:16S rRNA (uracil1498-N3)-methyltransferase
MDWLIQKATELGVATLVPLVTSRTVVRPRAARLASQRDRWQTIAIEAAQQSERWDIPTVSPPGDAVEFFRQQSSSSVRIILAERSSGKSLDRIPLPQERSKLVVLAIGPEGGWTEEETGQALESGFVPVTLGPRILRAETAALAALSVLQSRLGELG